MPWRHATHLPGIRSHYFLVRKWRPIYRWFNVFSGWLVHSVIRARQRHELFVLSEDFYRKVLPHMRLLQ